MSEKRLFKPRRTDDLVERARPWIGKVVTVESWHSNTAMRDKYPEDEWVGYILEFYGDIPESELLEVEEEEK